MYPVTTDFLDKVRASERRILGRVTIDYTDWQIDQSIQIATNEQANISYPAHTADGIVEPYAKYAALDGAWVLGQDFTLAPGPDEAEFQQMGWWGGELSGAGGAFTSPYPTLTVTHFGRPVHRLKVTGDSKREEWPVDFTIRLYGEDDLLLYTETVTGNTQIHWHKELAQHVSSVVKQVLTITKWSHAGRQVKVLEFFTSIQQTYELGDLVEINLLEEREIGIGTIPVGAISANEITIKLRNDDRRFDAGNENSSLYQLLKPNRRIRAWLGVRYEDETEEMVPLGTYWSTEWQAPENEVIATVTGRDRMELLRKSTYQTSQVLQNKTLAELAEIVLQDTGLTIGEYDIDPALQGIVVPYAWFEPVSHREALRLIAEAGMATAYADRDNKIRLEPFASGGVEPVLEIGPDQYFRADNPTKYGEVANEVIVETQPLRPVDTAQEVYRSNEPVTVPAGQTVTVMAHYNERPVIEAQASLNGATSTVIQSAIYYGWGAEVTLHNPGGAVEDITLLISGKPLKILNKERAVARDEDSIVDLGVLRYELTNPLVQTRQVAQQLADLILASVSHPRRDIEIDWRGNPALELGDRVASKGGEFVAIRNQLNWAGAFSAVMTGRRA